MTAEAEPCEPIPIEGYKLLGEARMMASQQLGESFQVLSVQEKLLRYCAGCQADLETRTALYLSAVLDQGELDEEQIRVRLGGINPRKVSLILDIADEVFQGKEDPGNIRNLKHQSQLILAAECTLRCDRLVSSAEDIVETIAEVSALRSVYGELSVWEGNPMLGEIDRRLNVLEKLTQIDLKRGSLTVPKKPDEFRLIPFERPSA